MKSNRTPCVSLEKNSLFTNCALTELPGHQVRGHGQALEHAIDWKGKEWTRLERAAAHANARFTAPASQCRRSARIGRTPPGSPSTSSSSVAAAPPPSRSCTQAFDFEQRRVHVAPPRRSETTGAALDVGQKLRRDPFAMTPFIGYHAGDYIAHWYKMGENLGAKAPACSTSIGSARTGTVGGCGPGSAENSRGLKWMCERVEGKVDADQESHRLYAQGRGPRPERPEDFPRDYKELMRVNPEPSSPTWRTRSSTLPSSAEKVPDKLRSNSPPCGPPG
jgi:phosphoenolpyruvate carboxykinase (GTP)